MICFPCLVVGLFSQDFIGGTHSREILSGSDMLTLFISGNFSFLLKHSQNIIACLPMSHHIHIMCHIGMISQDLISIDFFESRNLSKTVIHGLSKGMMVSLALQCALEECMMVVLPWRANSH